MKKFVACMTVVFLLLGLVGCKNTNGAGISPSAPEESSSAEQKQPTENGTSEQIGIDQGKFNDENTDNPNKKEPSVNIESDNDMGELMKISIRSDEYEIIYELNDSHAAKDLYAQLPLTMDVEPFSNNEMTFYPPEKLDTANTPLSSGEVGSLSYYSPWGDVVMFYAPCDPNGSLYELGTVISGKEDIEKLGGTVTVSAYTE